MKKGLNYKQVCNQIAEMEGTTIQEIYLTRKKRDRELVFVRQLCMAFAKKYSSASLSQIGAYVGDKDHATVLHAIKTISNLYDTDKEVRIKVDIYDNFFRDKGIKPVIDPMEITVPLWLFKKILPSLVLTNKEKAALRSNGKTAYELYLAECKRFPFISPRKKSYRFIKESYRIPLLPRGGSYLC